MPSGRIRRPRRFSGTCPVPCDRGTGLICELDSDLFDPRELRGLVLSGCTARRRCNGCRLLLAMRMAGPNGGVGVLAQTLRVRVNALGRRQASANWEGSTPGMRDAGSNHGAFGHAVPLTTPERKHQTPRKCRLTPRHSSFLNQPQPSGNQVRPSDCAARSRLLPGPRPCIRHRNRAVDRPLRRANVQAPDPKRRNLCPEARSH